MNRTPMKCRVAFLACITLFVSCISVSAQSQLNVVNGDFSDLTGLTKGSDQRQVPAGTSILITFQAAKFTPGLDNVSIAIKELASSAPVATPPAPSGPPVTVACYYFGNYHVGDPRNEKNKGQGWSEWELVKAAKPRFSGHHQPNVPLWGYTDESDPQVMARKIAAAADHGIDAFIFDVGIPARAPTRTTSSATSGIPL